MSQQLTDVVFSLWFDTNILLYSIALVYEKSAHAHSCSNKKINKIYTVCIYIYIYIYTHILLNIFLISNKALQRTMYVLPSAPRGTSTASKAPSFMMSNTVKVRLFPVIICLKAIVHSPVQLPVTGFTPATQHCKACKNNKAALEQA